MKKLWLLIFLFAPLAYSQAGAVISGQVVNNDGVPQPYAQVRICPSTGAGIPCTPTASIYADAGLTTPLPNPTTTDANGFFSAFVGTTYQFYLVQTTTNTTTYAYYANGSYGTGVFCPLTGCTIAGNLIVTGLGTFGNLTDNGTFTQKGSSSFGSAAQMTIDASGNMVTSGTFNGTSGVFSGSLQGATLTDGTASIHAGSITGAVNGTFSGTVAAGTTFWGGTSTVKTQPFSAFVTPEWWGAYGDGSHDDTTALQNCFNTSATLFGRCVLEPTVSYRFNATLTIPTQAHVQGSGPINSSILKCEVSGDCLKIASGPVQGVTLENFQVNLDSSLASSIGLDATAIPILVSGVTQGGLWDSSIKYVSFVGCPNECVKLYGGGGTGYAGNAPNQFLEFVHVDMGGTATASHAPLLDLKGEDNQITFIGGQINGDASYSSNYPILVNISNLTSGLNDAPTNVKFINETLQNAQGAMNANFVSPLSYDAGWIENVSTPFTVQNTNSFTIDGTHLANSGTTTAELVFASAKAAVRNLDIAGSTNPASIASCSSPSHVEFENVSRPLGSGTLLSSGSCATQQISTAATITPYADIALVNSDNGATPITTINSYTAPGKTITLTAFGSGYFSLASGGNINFTGIQSPYPVYGSIVLRKEDLGNVWVIENAPVQGTQYSDGSGGIAYSYDGTLTASATTYYGCRITARYTGTTGQYWGSAVCSGSASGPALFVTQASAPSSWTWTQINYSQTIAAGTAAMPTVAVSANSYSTTGATITTTLGSLSAVQTTDRVSCSANAQPSTTNAPLVRYCIPQAAGVLLVYYNPTAASITPTAETVNWGVVR